MKVHGFRTLTLAAVPLGLAGALLGPMAGPADAQPDTNCAAIQDEAFSDWDMASATDTPPRTRRRLWTWIYVLTRDYRRPLIIAGRWIPDGRIDETQEFDTGE